MLACDPQLRALYGLLRRVDGEDLERVREAIGARQRELDQAFLASQARLPRALDQTERGIATR